MSKYSSFTKAALPYAEALLKSSQAINLINKTGDDLQLIASTISQSIILKNFLSNPLVLAESKKKVLRRLFESEISLHVFNFLYILVERRRIQLFNSIVENYLGLVYQLELITIANVYSAVLLSDMQKKALENKLQRMTGSKKIELFVYIKPELLGGLVIKIGSKVIDMSIYGQLNQISAYLNVSSA